MLSPAPRCRCRRRERQLRNSLDAVADRDFALDYLYAVSVCFVHLSRIGEELVLWTTAEFGFATLGEDVATGSSMMPQKLNPDVAELVRGKAGTAIGRLTGLLATMKGLPLAYNRDLQEDKAPVFAARADVAGALAALTALVGSLELDRERLAAAAADPQLLATDAAEALVQEGTPFRDAHEQVAASVRDGSFEAPAPAPRVSPGPGGVREAVAAARNRLAIRVTRPPPAAYPRHENTHILLIAVPLVLAAALAAATLPGSASSAAAATETGGITVTGTASVSSVPDRAELSFGVESQGQTAKAALAANASRDAQGDRGRQGRRWHRCQDAVRLALAALQREPTRCRRSLPRTRSRLRSRSSRARARVIDAAVNAGANQVYGPSLSSGDQTELYRQALETAVANARTTAQVLAAAANVSLGRVTAIVEGGGAPQPLPFAADKAMAVESTPIEPGTQQTTANVTVTFSVS